MYPDNVLEQIKNQLNIVDVVSKYVNLKKVGRNYQGLCPFHAERTPSFFVNPELNIFKCFGCGVGGDIFKFVQEIEKLSFKEAVEKLAKQAGIELPKSSQDQKMYKLRQQVYKVLDVYSKFFQKVLFSKSGKNALQYLTTKRKLSIADIKKYKLGYAPSDAELILKFANIMKFDVKLLQQAGLLTDDLTPRFRYRIMFPLLDTSGRVIGFSGRTLSQSENVPKYLNTPETIVFKKRFSLFGLFWAKKSISVQDLAIITEGQMDVLSSMSHGVDNIVAPLGTALTETQLILLKRFTSNVAFAFDNDQAGKKALYRSVILSLKQGFTPHVIELPAFYDKQPIKDIDDLIKISPTKWKQIASNPVEFFDKSLQDLQQVQKENYVEVEAMLDEILEVLVYASKLRQELIIKQIAKTLDISQDAVQVRFDKIKTRISKINAIEEYKDQNYRQQDQNISNITHTGTIRDTVYKNTYNTIHNYGTDNYKHSINVSHDNNGNLTVTYEQNETIIALNKIQEHLEKYITTVILHYPVIAFHKNIKQTYKDYFYNAEYKAMIDASIQVLTDFLKQLDKQTLKLAQKDIFSFYEVFLNNAGPTYFANNMHKKLAKTNFFQEFTELGAMEPPFGVLDKNTLKDFLQTYKRFQTTVLKRKIKDILRQLDDLEQQLEQLTTQQEIGQSTEVKKGVEDQDKLDMPTNDGLYNGAKQTLNKKQIKSLIKKLNNQLQDYSEKLQQLQEEQV